MNNAEIIQWFLMGVMVGIMICSFLFWITRDENK